MTSKGTIVLAVLAGACLLASCGKPAEKPAAAPEPAPAAAAPEPEAPAPPAGVTKVTIASTHGAWPKEDVPDFGAPTAVAFKDSSVGNASVMVAISSYAFAPANRQDYTAHKAVEKGQARVELWLIRQKQVAPGETVEFVAGTYDPTKAQGQVEMTASANIVLTGGTSLTFSSPTGTIEVTSVTAGSISGKFDLKDKWTQLSGEFSAPLR